ncbi:unnamed protein product, partial [Polarella glacialis]
DLGGDHYEYYGPDGTGGEEEGWPTYLPDLSSWTSNAGGERSHAGQVADWLTSVVGVGGRSDDMKPPAQQASPQLA